MTGNGVYKETCPHCGYKDCEANFVDIGVGFTQCGPFLCDECGSYQTRDGSWNKAKDPIPEGINALNGKIVGHQEMLVAYKEEFTGNPLHGVDGVVDAWREKHREKPQWVH